MIKKKNYGYKFEKNPALELPEKAAEAILEALMQAHNKKSIWISINERTDGRRTNERKKLGL